MSMWTLSYPDSETMLRRDRLLQDIFPAVWPQRQSPEQYYEHLLRQLCSSFRSLTDAGLCWVEPCDIDDETFDEVEEELEAAAIGMSLDDFKILFAAWAMEIMTSQYYHTLFFPPFSYTTPPSFLDLPTVPFHIVCCMGDGNHDFTVCHRF